MNRRQLTYFIAVYEEGSIQSAADRLFISRQGVSKMLRQLEEELAQPLFERLPEGLQPTDFARSILPHVRQLLAEYDFIAGVKTLASQNQQVVRVYALDHLLAYLGADFVLSFREANPDIILSVTDTTDSDTMRALQAGICDYAMVNGPFDEQIFQGTPLFPIRYCLRAHKDHPLAKKDKATFADLDGETVVGKGRSYLCFRRKIDTYAFGRGVRLQILAETSDESILTSIAVRQKAVILEYDYTAKLFPHPDLVTVPFMIDTEGETVFLVTRKDAVPSHSARVFRRFLTDYSAFAKGKF